MRTRPLFYSIMALAGTFSHLLAQPGVERHSFDVASVKRADPTCAQAGIGGPRFSPGRIFFGCITLRALVQQAHNVLADGRVITRVTGGASWLDSERFSVEAKADNASLAEMLGPMLQELLTDRFHLEIHREPGETPVYFLVRSGREAKLRAADDGACVPRDWMNLVPPAAAARLGQGTTRLIVCGSATAYGSGETQNMKSRSVTMESFAVYISQWARRPVVDRTGIAGKYDIDLEFAHDDSGPTLINGQLVDSPKSEDSALPSFYRALQDTTGLKLVPGSAPIDVIVVDHVEALTRN